MILYSRNVGMPQTYTTTISIYTFNYILQVYRNWISWVVGPQLIKITQYV